jgi:CMP-N-acetylneuraminic acid synthetase
MRRTVKALIPVRSGSVRVANKNLKPFAGSTLLDIKISQLLKTPGLDGICVNSNDPQMLEAAAKHGVETCLRDSYFASNEVPMSEVYANLAENLQSDDVLFTHVTNPLADERTYGRIIENYRELDDDYDSIATVSDVKDFLYWDGRPVNYDPKRKPRSQDLPNIVKLNHVVSILPRETIIQRQDIMGHLPKFETLSDLESMDIDTLLDFEVAEFLYIRKLGQAEA